MNAVAKSIVMAVTLIAFTTLNSVAQTNAQNSETVEITFALVINPNALPDENQDGVPEIPEFTTDDFMAIVIGRSQTTATGSLNFAGGSPPCGDVEVEGSSWLRRLVPAMMVGKGHPIDAEVYGDYIQFPPEHSVVLARDVIALDACWFKFNGSDEAVVQSEYDGETVSLFVVVTAEFRIKGTK